MLADVRFADPLMRIVEAITRQFYPGNRCLRNELLGMIRIVGAFIMVQPDLFYETDAALDVHSWMWGAGWWPNASGNDRNVDWASAPEFGAPPGLGG